MTMSSEVAKVAADAFRAQGCRVSVNADDRSRFARLVVLSPEGVEFTIQIEEN
jgi:azurin